MARKEILRFDDEAVVLVLLLAAAAAAAAVLVVVVVVFLVPVLLDNGTSCEVGSDIVFGYDYTCEFELIHEQSE